MSQLTMTWAKTYLGAPCATEHIANPKTERKSENFIIELMKEPCRICAKSVGIKE